MVGFWCFLGGGGGLCFNKTNISFINSHHHRSHRNRHPFCIVQTSKQTKTNKKNAQTTQTYDGTFVNDAAAYIGRHR